MPMYLVVVPITGVISVEVEAPDRASAFDAALESESFGLDNLDEWEAHREICTGNVLHASLNKHYIEQVED